MADSTGKGKLDPYFSRSYHTDTLQIRSVVGIFSHYLTPSSPFTFRSLRVNPGVPELPWELFWFGSSLNTLIIDKHSSKFPMSRERPAPTVTLTCGYGRVCWRGVALMGQTEREWDPEWGWQGSQNLFSSHH